MSKYLLKYINNVRAGSEVFHFIQIRPFSCNSIEFLSKESSFTVNYLINSCGLSPIKAVSASKHMNFEVADKPDLVLIFLKEHGFTKTQIAKIVTFNPRLLLSNPQKSLLPKIEFFKSKGVSGSDIVEVISKQPGIFRRSVKNNLVPSFNFFSSFLESDEKTVTAFKRFARPLWYNNEEYVKHNIGMLKQIGVPVKNIGYVLTFQPTELLMSHDRFKKIVEKVNTFGFNPKRLSFLIAIHALNSMSQSTWDRKAELYKHWGWSEDDVVSAFRKNPWCMIKSEDKINLVMDFWVNKMGWKSLLVANWPSLMSYSLEKRIAPRCEVYHFLISNSLADPAYNNFSSMLSFPENRFVERFIEPHKEKAPGLLTLYKQKLDLAK